ncbi:hypothetical protein Ahy_A03g011607 [Arachis hypogaea]|uniref:SWIM-type domain-containing protein n=1 Tax=Arachis hypogaea TaxID=3818 RepID=A0A445DR85_ARAHY|nr:hypothetical protein Ahy_A03g011607 [Arachis hypogaea]
MASPSPSMERRSEIVFEVHPPILRVSLNYRIVAVWHRVAGDEDTTRGEADHGVGSAEGEGFAGLESDEYDLQEDETEHDHPIVGERSAGFESDENDFQEDDAEHDHHAEADVDNGDAVELENSLDGTGGMSENYAEDEFYAVDSGESIAICKAPWLRRETFQKRKSGEVRIRQEFVCHRQGFRSPKFYSMPNRQKRPRAETQCGCPARMLLRMDDESGRWHVAFFSDAHNHHVLELRFSSMLPGHRKMSEADIEQMNDMRKGGIGVSRIHGFMASLAGGYHNVPYTTRDMHNVNAKQRREGGLDAESCLRCEGLHAVISRYVKSRYSYTEFLRHFHRCLMFVRAKEVEADFECAKGDPVMTTNLKQLERSAADNYTRVIFYLFVPILDRACAMRVVDSEDNGSHFIHTVSRYGTRGKEWRVVATSDTREARCTCMRMECFGVPCEHIIAVLVLNNVHEIPRSLILPRWTKDAKLVAMQSMGVIWNSFARDIVVLMLKHFENEDAGNTSFPHEGPPTEGGRPPARNPPKRNTKGNGAHGGKKTQRCRLCREVGHNRTTCPERRTMEPSSAVAEDMDSMDTDMVYDNLSGDLYATAEIPSFQCSDSDTQAGFANNDFAGTNTSGPVMSLAD